MASRETFERVFWQGQADAVPFSVRCEYWDDYKRVRARMSVRTFLDLCTAGLPIAA
jgi:hypothetical protein